MGPLVEALRARGARIEPLGAEGFLPLRIEGGTLTGGEVSIRADVSSQFVSALLLASPVVAGGLSVRTEGRPVSGAYVELTRRVLAAFAPEGAYRPARFVVPGDDSAACFPIAGALVSGGRVRLEGPRSGIPPARRGLPSVGGRGRGRSPVGGEGRGRRSRRGRQACPDRRSRRSRRRDRCHRCGRRSRARRGATARGTPGLLPGHLPSPRRGETPGEGVGPSFRRARPARTGRERWPARRGPPANPSLVIEGPAGRPRRADFAASDDHRVAMAAAVLALTLPAGCTLDTPEVVSKSYPRFWDDWAALVAPR